MNFVDHGRQARELQIVGLLEAVCQSLEPTPPQTAFRRRCALDRTYGLGLA